MYNPLNYHEMSEKHFGLEINENVDFNARDIAARLFLCPRVSGDVAPEILRRIRHGELSVKEFCNITDNYIELLKEMKADGEDLSERMREKFESWDEALGLPSDEDLEYLSDCYGFTREDIYGPERFCSTVAISSPKDLANRLKEYIKGQDDAIDALSVPVFLHLDSMRRGYTSGIKSPILLMGPTGCGKSELLRRCGELCDCPVIRINLSSVTAEGWRGTNISDIILSELRADVPMKKLEYAIIVFNEFDKITHYGCKTVGDSRSDGDFDMMRDVMRFFESGYSVPLCNGNDIVSGLTPMTHFPVDNLLMVFDGAFFGIEGIIRKRLNIDRRIGFERPGNADCAEENLLRMVTNDDLVEWGYMPELIGRIGRIVPMKPLSSNIIYEIMTLAEDNVVQGHVDFCACHGINLLFDESALRCIADAAYKSGLGFRNVKALLSKVMEKIYFELPDVPSDTKKRSIRISRKYVETYLCDTK